MLLLQTFPDKTVKYSNIVNKAIHWIKSKGARRSQTVFLSCAETIKRRFFRMSRNTRSKLTCTAPLGYDNTFKLLAFHTFLSRQTNLKSESSVLSVKQG